MIIIGITGSIGMGKTTVSKMLEILKIPIFDSDKKVKEILEKNSKVIKKIIKTWPDTVSKNQKLVKKERELFLKNFKQHSKVGLDIPLLYETGMDEKCDYVFLVNTTMEYLSQLSYVCCNFLKTDLFLY